MHLKQVPETASKSLYTDMVNANGNVSVSVLLYFVLEFAAKRLPFEHKIT